MPDCGMTIGILGGMGSLAAAEFLTALVRAFPGEKEWDRPRTVLDNACHMPSRVRAILYGEKREELIRQLAEHMAGLTGLGCTDLVLCCNTSHSFLPQVEPLARELAGKPFKVHHIIRLLGESLKERGVSRVSLLATEGTLEVGIYPQILSEYGIDLVSPGPQAYPELRFLIEAVKQNAMDQQALRRFVALINAQPCQDVVLGCTEFPLLRARLPAGDASVSRTLHDPLEATIRHLVKAYQAAQQGGCEA